MCTLSRRDLTCESSGRCRCSRLQALYIDVSIPPTSPLLLGKGSSLSDACPAKSCTSPLFLGKGSSRFDACPAHLSSTLQKLAACKQSTEHSHSHCSARLAGYRQSHTAMHYSNHFQCPVTLLARTLTLPSAGRRRKSPPASECRGISWSTSLSPR